ncbi:MAG: hypothetical protein M1396_06700 [Chloroflexi bacterium]|nr:hypothetical protein [Chloroflexota bacterium]
MVVQKVKPVRRWLASSIALSIVTMFALGGCGPRSITEHFPRIERPYFFQKTSVVHEPLSRLLLGPRQLFPATYRVAVVPGDALLLPRLDPLDVVLTPGGDSGIGGRALVTYNVFSGNSTHISLFSTVQITLFAFPSLARAVTWLDKMHQGTPDYSFFRVVRGPGVSPHEFARQVALIGYEGKLVYIQQRNIVIRVVTIVPQNQPSFRIGDGAAAAESAMISATR